MQTAASEVITRAELVLAMAQRARTPADANAVGQAAGRLAKYADSHEAFDLIEEALGKARTIMDAYMEERVVPISRRRH
jgi:hypothetical protein